MEFIEGETLSQRLAALGGKLPPSDAVWIGKEVAVQLPQHAKNCPPGSETRQRDAVAGQGIGAAGTGQTARLWDCEAIGAKRCGGRPKSAR